MPTPALERPCLSLRERWQRREPLTERDVGGDAHIAPQHKNNAVIICGTSGGRPLHSSSRKVCACRGRCPPSPRLIQMAFPFIAGRSAARVQPSQSPAVTAPPKGEPRHAHTRIGAALPLPSGEVAAARAADGEGRRGRCPHRPAA